MSLLSSIFKRTSSSLLAVTAMGSLLLLSAVSSGQSLCLEENGCKENETVTYGVKSNLSFNPNHPYSKAGQLIFATEQESYDDVCSEAQAYADAYNCPSAAASVTVTCSNEVTTAGFDLNAYSFPRVLESCTTGQVMSQNPIGFAIHRRAKCETPPYTFPRYVYSNGNHEQCWRCPTAQRQSKAPQFATVNATGNVTYDSNSVVWYSPEACPEEYLQNEPCDKETEGNPVACDSGAKVMREVDYQAAGDSLSFTRLYSAQPIQESLQGPTPAGAHWGTAETLRLTVLKDEAHGRLIEIRQGESLSPSQQPLPGSSLSANERVYLYIGGGGATTLDSSRPDYGTVKLESEGWVWYTAQGGKVVFGANGMPERRERRGGLITYYQWQELADIGPVVSTMTSENGRQLQFTYNTSGQLIKLTDPAGDKIHYLYDTHGNLVEVIYPDDTPATLADNPRKLYHYEDARFINHLTGITDENGSRLSTYAYDDQGRAVLSTWADNAQKTTFDYVSPGITEISRHINDTEAHTFTYHFENYHGGDRITQIEHHACDDCTVGTETREYDHRGRLEKRIAADGTETRYTYHSSGRERYRTQAYGTDLQKTITTNWNNTHGVISSISDNGRYTSYKYNTNGQITEEKVEGAKTRYTYNTDNRLSRVDGPRTDVQDLTDYTYDSQGNRLSMTNALGHITTFDNYDDHGRMGQITDPNGVVTTLTYTPRGWLASSTTQGRTTTYYYDNVGQLVEVQSPGGIRVHYQYDAAHRLVAIIDDAGNRLDYTLDYRGNRLAETITDSAGTVLRQQSQRFNAMSQLLEVINGANQSVVEHQYDAAGRVIEETSNTINGPRSTQYHYDALGRISQSVDALNGVTAFDYNVHNALTRVEDARGLATDYTVNTRGEVTQLDSPDTSTTAYLYDNAGNRTRSTDSRGVVTNYTYDALNRLTGVLYPSAPALNVTYTYDQGSYGIGRLTRIDDATGHTTYSYDAWGNITSQTQVTDGNTYTVGYSYNADNQLESITYPSGQVITYSLDAIGAINAVTTTAGGNTENLATGISYLPFGPADGWTLGNDLTVNRSFDQDYRLTGVATTPVIDYSYAYDPAGNIIEWHNLLDTSRSQSFDYDELDRLITATGVYGDLGYDYDPVGNRLSKTDNTITDSYNYAPDSNRLLGVFGAISESMTYDAVGNIITRDGKTFIYNAANRLAGVEENSQPLANYQHNGKGERVSKAANGTTTQFVYDLMGNIIAEADGAGVIQREYVYLNGERLAMLDTTTTAIYYYHNDHLATPKALTDETGAVVWQGDYTPFGELTEVVSLVEQPFRFPGQYYDGETGLYYNYFRDYDPTIGRYVQSDPIGLDGGINTYGYVEGNPLIYSDPSGWMKIPMVPGAGNISGWNVTAEAERRRTIALRAASKATGECIVCISECFIGAKISDITLKYAADRQAKRLASEAARSAAKIAVKGFFKWAVAPVGAITTGYCTVNCF